MPEYWLIVCFSQVIKAPTSNISSTVRFDKNWELENGEKKIRVFMFRKIAKTGKIGKKTVSITF